MVERISSATLEYPDAILELIMVLSPYKQGKRIPINYRGGIPFALRYGLIEPVVIRNSRFSEGSAITYRLLPGGYNKSLEILRKRAEMDTRYPRDISIDGVGLSTRSLHALMRAHIRRVSEVLELSDEELLRFRTLGEIALKEIRDKTELYRRKET